jgi:hypothetical protein
MQEAEIIIDGKKLTVGESMTVRVALSSFISDMQENGLGDDEIGKAIAEGYIKNGTSALKKMDIFNT